MDRQDDGLFNSSENEGQAENPDKTEGIGEKPFARQFERVFVPERNSTVVGSFYNETVRHETKTRTTSRFKRIFALVTAASILGGVSIGFGYGVGSKLASNYILPKLASDKENLRTFTITPIYGTTSDDGNITQNYIYSYSAIIAMVEPAVVQIYTVKKSPPFYSFRSSADQTGAGSGMIFHETDNNYYILTNAHVVSGSSSVFVSVGEASGISAKLVGKDEEADIAVISISKADSYNAGVTSLSPVTFGNSDLMQVGDMIVSIGNALGEGNTATNGIISAKDREIVIDGVTYTVLQTNAAINKGNSGGPLVNMHGEVIGMSTAKLLEQSVEGMGYGIPSNIIIPIIETLMQGGKPMIGIRGEDVPAAYAEDLGIEKTGAIVRELITNGPAEKAGVKIADIITAFNGQPVSSMKELSSIVSACKTGDVAELTILRNGREELVIRLVLEEYLDTEF